MKARVLFIALFTLMNLSCMNSAADQNQDNTINENVEYALVIHGGAGTITRTAMTHEREAEYIKALNEALDAGDAVLTSGGTALEAVEAVVVFMEDNPLFNAGKGAVFTNEGKNELDASIMTGHDLNAGAIGGSTKIKNPIKAAIAVMNHSPHVMLSGKGADTFAGEQGLELVDPAYFHTDSRWNSLQKSKGMEDKKEKQDAATRHGTVGAVALDKHGNIAAATSTGGMTNKKYNRIGDTPIIGAGTYASNQTCGISATGHGEFFMRLVVAYAIHAQMKYGGKTLQDAAHDVIHHQLENLGGDGGIIGLDAEGNIAMTFNSEGMYRGWVKKGEREVLIYKD